VEIAITRREGIQLCHDEADEIGWQRGTWLLADACAAAGRLGQWHFQEFSGDCNVTVVAPLNDPGMGKRINRWKRFAAFVGQPDLPWTPVRAGCFSHSGHGENQYTKLGLVGTQTLVAQGSAIQPQFRRVGGHPQPLADIERVVMVNACLQIVANGVGLSQGMAIGSQILQRAGLTHVQAKMLALQRRAGIFAKAKRVAQRYHGVWNRQDFGWYAGEFKKSLRWRTHTLKVPTVMRHHVGSNYWNV